MTVSDVTEQPPPEQAERTGHVGRSLWTFRILVTLMTFSGFLQAVLAGGFMQGHIGALPMHEMNANLLAVEAIALIVAAIVMWRPGGGPAWPIWVSVLLLFAIGAQAGFGYQRLLSLHVPLGVSIISGMLVLLIWSWSSRTVWTKR